jgi:hypothetical protein
MPQTAAHAWFAPKLKALLLEADQAGYPRDLAVAVITDLVNGALGVDAKLDPAEEDWARDIGEPPGQEREMPVGETPPDDPVESMPIDAGMPHMPGRGPV